jgi:hypothetical protein
MGNTSTEKHAYLQLLSLLSVLCSVTSVVIGATEVGNRAPAEAIDPRQLYVP